MFKIKPIVINIVLSVIALGLHAYLTQKFFDLQNGAASGQSLCNVGALWNCDAVSTSKYAQIFGYPLALWAFSVHLVYIVTQIGLVFNLDSPSFWSASTRLGSVVIAAASVIMLAISLTQLKNYCLFCFLAYGISFLSLILIHFSGLKLTGLFKDLPKLLSDKTSYGFLVSIPVLVLSLASAWGGPFAESRVKEQIQDQILAWKAAPEQSFDLSLGLHMGAPVETAKMVIVEFADFRCPHCKFAAPTLKAFTQSRDDVALLFKPFPLDGTCNPSPAFNGQGDGISCRLASAAFCSESLNQSGWAMTQMIFDKQEDFRQFSKIEQVDELLCQLNSSTDCEKLKLCMSEEKTKTEIQKMAQEGLQANIRGTPAFFVNKKELGGGQYMPILQAVEKEL
ncbi:MAG: vitamin K epoxide reductase family protein [Bdellovibrionales bacterium]